MAFLAIEAGIFPLAEVDEERGVLSVHGLILLVLGPGAV
jgi:hypothetical protein